MSAARTVPAPEPSLADRLRRLARRVEHLGRGRCSPEEVLAEKELVAQALRRIASEIGA